jgi:hypothetical protein
MNKGKNSGIANRCGMLALVAAAGIAVAMLPAAARAQETGGSIFGWAPAGQTVTVKGVTSGARRHAKVKDSGQYSIGRLPLGIYTVTLEKDGAPVETRSNISLKVGRGAEVDFACPDDHCEARDDS